MYLAAGEVGLREYYKLAVTLKNKGRKRTQNHRTKLPKKKEKKVNPQEPRKPKQHTRNDLQKT